MDKGVRIRVDPHPPHLPVGLHHCDLDEVLFVHVIERIVLPLGTTTLKQRLSRQIGIGRIPCLLEEPRHQ